MAEGHVPEGGASCAALGTACAAQGTDTRADRRVTSTRAAAFQRRRRGRSADDPEAGLDRLAVLDRARAHQTASVTAKLTAAGRALAARGKPLVATAQLTTISPTGK